jgi:hypothetical protein
MMDSRSLYCGDERYALLGIDAVVGLDRSAHYTLE